MGTSLAYYFCDFNVVLNGGKNPIRVTVISLPETDVSILFPETFEQFTSTVTKTWEKLFTESNFVIRDMDRVFNSDEELDFYD